MIGEGAGVHSLSPVRVHFPPIVHRPRTQGKIPGLYLSPLGPGRHTGAV